MIILNRGEDRRIVYYNLKEKKAYTLDVSKDPEVSIEVPRPFAKDVVEGLILYEIGMLQDCISFIEESGDDMSNQDRLDVIRFKQNIEYLINYEY